MDSSLVVVSAADRESLLAEIARVVRFLDRMPEIPLSDVAYTCSLAKGAERLVLVVESVAGLRARLVSAHGRLGSPELRRIRDKSGTYYFSDHLLGDGRGRLAFVYPGVMSFYPDMLRDLAIGFPECRSAFDELEEAMAGSAEFSPSSFIFPPAAYYRHDADIFRSGAYAQALVSVYSAGVGMTRILRSLGLAPDGVVGFAGGDLAAMMRSGAAGESRPRTERVAAITEIYRIVDRAVNHAGLPETALIAVLLRSDEAQAQLEATLASFPEGKATLALDLSPRQKTYAIAPDFAAAATAAFAAAGIRSMRLALDRPFNTPRCEDLVPAILKFATKWMQVKPSTAVYSCATAEPVPDTLVAARKDTAGRWSRPVRFADTIRRMYADGYRVFVEVGPRGLMTSFVEDTLKGMEHAALATNSIHRRGLLQLQHAIAQLVALGADMDVAAFAGPGARRIDFDAAILPPVRRETEMLLSRRFPRLTLLSDLPVRGASVMAEPRGRGAKAAARQAAIAESLRRRRQFEAGAMNPLVSDVEPAELTPGVSIELDKTFRLSDYPFIGDFAIGSNQLSYSDPNLRGLVLLSLPAALEIMAEAVSRMSPGLCTLVAIEDVSMLRNAIFRKGALTLHIRAERVASGDPARTAIKVLAVDDHENAAFTSATVSATFVLAKEYPAPAPIDIVHHAKPRTVHWSGREVYPSRLGYGKRLRNIDFVETWSESGLDYTVRVPESADAVRCTRFPVWSVNPLLLGSVVSGFPLWRSHERFPGACSFPYHCRRIEFLGPLPKEGSRVNCYMRLTGVTNESQVSDIAVSGGDGLALLRISGWEERCDRVNPEYRDLVMQPATSFITRKLGWNFIGNPATEVATAYVTDIPYRLFSKEKNDEIWLHTFSHIVLSSQERLQFADKPGSNPVRTEWLFGRIAAKEAVRRYLRDFHQARWSYADVEIVRDDMGKPHAVGGWQEYLRADIDVSIAHTSEFVVAVAAANARVGVDVEKSERGLSDEFTGGVLSLEERDLAAQSGENNRTVIRFWCAKEAVSKALGTGIRYSPKEMNVVSYQADTGALAVRLDGEWVKAFPQFKGRDIGVTVRYLHDHALAFCFIPSTVFPKD